MFDASKVSHLGQTIDSDFMIYIFQDRYVPDLYNLAHVSSRKPYHLHDLTHVSWVRSVLYRSGRTSLDGR